MLVAAGTYVENVVISGKDIALIGEDRETTIIDGDQSGSVIWVGNSFSYISDFTIQNGSGTAVNDNQYKGGGIYTAGGGETALTINNAIIKNNHLPENQGEGGGMRAD